MLITCVMRNARAHKLQWSGPTVHSSTVAMLTGADFKRFSYRLLRCSSSSCLSSNMLNLNKLFHTPCMLLRNAQCCSRVGVANAAVVIIFYIIQRFYIFSVFPSSIPPNRP